MDERLKFVVGLLDGERMAVLCRRFITQDPATRSSNAITAAVWKG
jgi:hypothetical protein